MVFIEAREWAVAVTWWGGVGWGRLSVFNRLFVPSPVYACKLSDREHPLYLRLVAGPRTDTLSFVLREHEIGEVSERLLTVASNLTEQLACFISSRRWGGREQNRPE